MSGFYGGSPVQLQYLRGVVANTTWARGANVTLKRVYIKNNTANAVTGGIRFGSTAGGVDIVVALSVGASAVVDATPLISLMSGVASTVYIEAVVAWNSANVDIALEFTAPF